ncbi:MAG: hypothetical protein QNJ46_21560 [Leptolyngbyaceae cyanobacterium MO_188.B28]|nr:hypothetical protein [Leptolyngbyaceae cyanobacterium MO_188.B28]
MRNTIPGQEQVKVAVYAAQAHSPESQRQRWQDLLASTLIGLGALVGFWLS